MGVTGMRWESRAAGVAMLCLAWAGNHLQAATVVLGEPPRLGTGNCDPFGCPGSFGLGTYQQVFLSTAFPGTISIDGLAFFESQVLSNGGQPAAGTYALSFSYTSFGPGNLNLTSPGANVGSGSQGFFTGALPALTPEGAGNELIITGTPFVYDPADGDLLLTVTVTGAANPGPALYLDEAECGPKTFCPPGTSVVSSNAYFGTINGLPVSGGNSLGGLITEFDYTTVSGNVPEPGSMFLVLAGFAMIACERRRRRVFRVNARRTGG